MDFLAELQTWLNGGMAVRLAIDLVCVFVLIRVIYYRAYQRADLFLTFFAFNLVIFLIAYVLNSVEMTLGAAFGLFAVFSMLRYRTEGISTIDMTYLFLGIALGLIMAVSDAGPLQLMAVGAVVLGLTQLLEGGWLVRRELRQQVHYDRIELVDARARAELLADLRQRTGLNVHRFEVQEIDLLRDAARLYVYYYADAELAPPAAGAPPMNVSAASASPESRPLVNTASKRP
jgi:hypothetical protein